MPATGRKSKQMGESIRKAAAALGVDESTLRDAMTRGRVVKSVYADGTINVRALHREWVENAQRAPGPIPPGTKGPQGVGATLQAAKASQAVYEAKLAELEYRKKVGELIPAKDVESAVYEVARRVRDRLQTLPSRLAPVVAGLAGSQDECYRVIEDEVNLALDELGSMNPNGDSA